MGKPILVLQYRPPPLNATAALEQRRVLIMSASDIESRLRQVLRRSVSQPIDPARITADTVLLGQGLGLDSVAMLEFIVGIEQEFGLELDESRITPQGLRTFGALARMIERMIEAERAGKSC
jgi:acyl carrier protein